MNQDHAPVEQVTAPGLLSNPILRECYVQELTELMGSSMWEHADDDRRQDLMMGIESGLWALEKRIKQGLIKLERLTA